MGRIIRFRQRSQGCKEDGRWRRQTPRPRGPSQPFGFIGRSYGIIALIVLCALAFGWQLSPERDVAPSFIAARQPADATGRDSPQHGRMVSRNFPLCDSGRRSNCIVDGDTLWIEGEKIRVADIDTPEISSPGCAAEARAGERAKQRLRQLVNAGPFELVRSGRATDRFGRSLYTLNRGGRSLGETLVAEGLAERWGGARIAWCA